MTIPKAIRITTLCLTFGLMTLWCASGYWGLRRINVDSSPSTYELYKAEYYAWTVHWGRTESTDNQFNWTMVDRILEYTETNRCKTVVIINPSNPWATNSELRAPNDINRMTPLAAPAPAQGYSASLYDFTFNLVDHIAQYNPSLLSHLRFANEPYFTDQWQLTEATYEQDVDDYIRCLRTVYIAAHKAADNNNVSIMVSHGGLNYHRQLDREWYQLGENEPQRQQEILELFYSRYERHFQNVDDWDDFRKWVEDYDVLPHCYWTDMLARQSKWMDCFEVHYHFKPRFISSELQAFENAVIQAGGQLKPWFAAEAAMQVCEQGRTPFHERFHAGDMVRKWFSGMAFGLRGICTPITGYPAASFYGLYDEDDNEYLAAQCYRMMRRLVPQPTTFKDISKGGFIAYRFRWGAKLVDVFWLDQLSDKNSSTELYEAELPTHFRCGRVIDIFCNELMVITSNKDNMIRVSQEPILIVWDLLSAPPPDSAGSGRKMNRPNQ